MVMVEDESVMQNVEEVSSSNGVGADRQAGSAESRDGKDRRSQEIVWRNVVLMALYHIGAVYALSLIPKAYPLTWIWGESRLLVYVSLFKTVFSRRKQSHLPTPTHRDITSLCEFVDGPRV
ncbi:UNVERIFIED_CONTAM: hypothetical protein FKN15_018833 [Acipenser sinensis]